MSNLKWVELVGISPDSYDALFPAMGTVGRRREEMRIIPSGMSNATNASIPIANQGSMIILLDVYVDLSPYKC
jgi:hypothetical protein